MFHPAEEEWTFAGFWKDKVNCKTDVIRKSLSGEI